MKLIVRLFFFCVLASFLFTACQKEVSVESKGGTGVIVGGGTAEGTFGLDASDSAECANAIESGAIGVGLPLTDSNTVTVEMNFTQIGTYYVSTDTVNGIYFSKNGTVTTTGPTQIVLTGSGTPTAAGPNVFTVSFKGSVCSFSLTAFNVAQANGTDYFPTTAGSSWSYKSSDPQAEPGDTIYNIATNASYTILTNTYTLFTSENGSARDSLFFNKSGGEYHQFGDLDIAGADSNVVASDYIFLKDNVATGTEWNSPEGDAVINSTPAKIRLKFILKAKDVTVLLGSYVYKDVIKVTVSEQVQLPAGWTSVLSYETWYAKGIGMINVLAPTPLYGYQLTSFKVL